VSAPDLGGRTVLAVFAHPDDESLACGGTLARLADAGARVVLLCASRGMRGHANEIPPKPDPALGRMRVEELHRAASILGIAHVIVLDHPDGDLRWAEVSELHDDIVQTIRDHRPDAIITFDEDGLYWHLDHIGVHERTKTAVASLGSGAPPLYYVTMPHGVMQEIVTAAVARGWTVPSVGLWSIVPNAFGILAKAPSFAVDVRAWVPRKLSALLCHRTQVGDDVNPLGLLEPSDARRLLGVELFRREPSGDGAIVMEALAGSATNTAEATGVN
jgi:N-acetylglucosamine malate deacetylase 2